MEDNNNNGGAPVEVTPTAPTEVTETPSTGGDSIDDRVNAAVRELQAEKAKERGETVDEPAPAADDKKPEPPKEDPAPKTEDDKKFAAKFAALDRERRKNLDLQKEISAKMKEFETKQAEHKAKEDELNQRVKEIDEDFVGYMLKKGMDPQDLIDSLLEGKGKKPVKNLDPEELKAQIRKEIEEDLDKKQKEQYNKSQEEREAAAIKNYERNTVAPLLAENKDSLKFLHLHFEGNEAGMAAEVTRAVEILVNRDGKPLGQETVKEAANRINDFLKKQTETLAQKLGYIQPNSQSNGQGTGSQTETPKKDSVTLTNGNSAAVTRAEEKKSRDEILADAIAELEAKARKSS